MKPLRSKVHLAFIREQACCIARMHVCGGVIEPMHYRGSKEGGVGMKPGGKRAKAKAKGPKKRIPSRPFSKEHRPLRRKVAA
jgi:hypothetical protein